MTFSYTTGFLTSASGTTVNMYKVRRLIGDTDSAWQLLADEEIYFALNFEPSPTLAAAAACDMIAAGFLRQCNTENSELRVSAAARHKHYMAFAERLRAGGAGDVPGDGSLVLANMYVGGQSVAAKQALDDNSDNAGVSFRIGQDDNPEIGWSDTTSASI